MWAKTERSRGSKETLKKGSRADGRDIKVGGRLWGEAAVWGEAE